MPGVANGNGPSYISAHSADVILSDIRPVKLKPEALGAINVLLDEFLHIILTTSRSLSTERLRSSLLSVLPTSLGKEALLEAEVELRAYWERTNSRAPPEDDSGTFHLQWSFELLRLKCSAYSTLNEDDEEPTAEVRVNDIFSKAHSHPPQVGLLDPAALYLTAILESMCEHILSNVGRVAARDSSRTYATTNDLFVALCEDDSIYGFFRSMKVYHQIETMAEAKSRRCKSISLHDQSQSRTSSPNTELSSITPSAQSRPSSEGQSTNVPSPLGESRTSGEKLRRRNSAKGHNRTSSNKSEVFRQVDESHDPTEDAALQREFDDLMRSASTMKMSLTPDRLKTMEAFKQEKDQKSFGRRPDAPFPVKSSGPPPPSLGHLKHNSQVASTSTFQGIVPARLRSLSTSGSSWSKLTRAPSVKTSSKASLSSSVSTHPSTEMRTVPRTTTDNGFLKRTRAKGRNLESMDLDDIMNRSDDDLDVGSMSSTPVKPATPPKQTSHSPQKTSQSTRDLIEFLAEGPPEAPSLSKAGRELVDFLTEGPPNYASSIVSLDKSGGSGNRLQKMMSKLNLGHNEKPKGGSDVTRTLHHSRVESKSSSNTLSSLANKPIPPRPPRAPNAPSAFPACDMPDENKAIPQRTTYPDSPSRGPSIEKLGQEQSKTIFPPIPPLSSSSQPHMAEKAPIPVRSPPSVVVQPNGIANGHVPRGTPPPRGSSQHALRSPIKATIPPPPVAVQSGPTIAEPDIRDMHRLLTNATTADECRLIFGMFMARNGISLEPKQEFSNQVPLRNAHTGLDACLESSLVEVLLGNSTSFDFVAS